MSDGLTSFRNEHPPLGAALELMQRLWTLNHELERMSARMSRQLGITAQQRMVLRIVGRFPGITSGRLSDLLCVDAATVSTAMTRLEKRGLVRRQRDPQDGRRVSVALTPEGRALDVPTTGTVEGAVEAALSRTPPADVEVTKRVLEALTLALIERHGVAELSARKAPKATSRSRARHAR